MAILACYVTNRDIIKFSACCVTNYSIIAILACYTINYDVIIIKIKDKKKTPIITLSET